MSAVYGIQSAVGANKVVKGYQVSQRIGLYVTGSGQILVLSNSRLQCIMS